MGLELKELEERKRKVVQTVQRLQNALTQLFGQNALIDDLIKQMKEKSKKPKKDEK